jgi:hypothetical protein
MPRCGGSSWKAGGLRLGLAIRIVLRLRDIPKRDQSVPGSVAAWMAA